MLVYPGLEEECSTMVSHFVYMMKELNVKTVYDSI